ncbi:MAG TPA: EAL domain-containing protein [Usitatibacter sp.]|nr:EAL domain-containing protein [Usitatibacter sp.]
MNRPLRPHVVALAALALGVAATLLAWFMAARQADREARVEFNNHANLAANLLERRVQRYVDVLYGLEALAYHETDLSRADFSRYAAALEIHRRFAGLTAVEFIRRVKEEDREAFVASVRDDRSAPPANLSRFSIRPAGTRREYWVVDYVEPYPGNEAVFGLDIRMREGARNAAERARDTGEATATGRYRLVQEKSTSFGLVLYLPVYGPGPFLTREERREALRGFVNVVLRVDDIFADMLNEPALHGIRMRIHDVGAMGEPAREPSGDTLFFETAADEGKAANPWLTSRGTLDRPLAIAGRQWLVRFEDEPALSPWLTPFPLLVLGAGLAMSALLFGILFTVARTRSEAVALASKATRELRSQLSFTQQLIEVLPNPVFYKDREGRYLGVNRACEQYFGQPRESIIGKRYGELAPSELASRSDEADRALMESPGTVSYESRGIVATDGAPREVIVNKATFLDPNGEIAGIVGSLVDITQRKTLEKETQESIELLRAVIQAAPVAIVARDMNRVISMWNPAAERMFGWKESEVLGTNTSIVPPELVEEASRYRALAQKGETHLEIETRRMHRDGHAIDVSLSAAPIYGGDGKVVGTMVTIADLTQKKAAEAALRESESQLRLAMDAAQLGMWYWETESDRFTYSEGLNVLFGRPAESSLANYRDLRERVHPDDRELVDATLRHAIKQGDDFSADFRVVWPDGSVHWIANRGQVHRDLEGRAQRLIGVGMNITERKIAEQRVAHMAHHDALTGLPNRVLLRDRIQQAIAQAHRNGTQLAVLFLDLDRFKTINDSLGHQLGDRLLQSVASRILVCVREGDTVSRVGGDEFVIVIPGIGSASDASSVAGKILEVLGSAFHLHGNDLHVAASIGISLYPADGSDAETLMRNADTAMYHAKDSGRGNFQFFTQHMNVAAQQRLNLENSLRRALEAREFELHYQPLFNLRDRSITGFEALLRWHPADASSVVAPAEFITVAEDSGLIVPIGEWVMREALRHAKSWQSPGRPLTISINVSATQLSRSVFVERLRRLVNEFGIDPHLIELEVTERVIIEGAGDAREALDDLAALGVGIAIDDFGTGYSGLAYLKRLPIDTVKIDQSFVRDLTVDPDDAAIVTAIVAMAGSLDVEVVAEGIETEEQLEELRRLGCQRGQGYLLARPMPAAQVARLLSRAAEKSA